MVVSIRLSEQETSLIKDYAKLYNTVFPILSVAPF